MRLQNLPFSRQRPSALGRSFLTSRAYAPGGRQALLMSTALSASLGLSMAEGQGLVELTVDQIKQRGEVEIGAFTQIEAQVDRFYRDQKFGEGPVGDRLLSNEIVSSYEDGLAVLTFDDGTTLTVGPYSEILLDEYFYDLNTNEGSLSLNILSGMAKLTTGSMEDGSFSVDTPVGTAAIRGSEVIFFVEPEDGVSIGVLVGGVSLVDPNGRLVASAAGDSNAADFLFATILEDDTLQVQQGAITPVFRSILVPLDTPSAHPEFIIAYKSEVYGPEIIEACLNGGDCGPEAQAFIDELAENYVELQDAVQALIRIRGQVEEAGGDPGAIQNGITQINEVLGLLENTYVPNEKPRPGAIEDGEGEDDDAGAEEALTGLGAGAGAGLGSGSPTPPTADAAPTNIALTNSSIAENATSFQVGLLQVTDDATVNPNFTFALLANGITNDHLAFSINDATGALSFNSQPDFETQASYTFNVQVTDEGGNSYTETLTVTVTDVPDTGTFWSDAMVADSATVTLTGTALDDYAGYGAASLGSPSALSKLGAGTVVSATISLGNGSNHLLVGDSAAISGGAIACTGGTGRDTLNFGDAMASSAVYGSTITLNLGSGQNTVNAGQSAGAFSSFITINGGADTDAVSFGNGLAGNLTVNLGDGTNSFAATSANTSTIAYTGGAGVDTIRLSTDGDTILASLNLGVDTAADLVRITGPAVAVTLQNFDVTRDQLDLPATASEAASNFTFGSFTVAYADTTAGIAVNFVGLGPAGANVSLTALAGAMI